MNYLFFDTECAHGRGGICEFGYIITDEKFNIITADNLLINPHIKFDDYGHKKAGIVFAYSKDEYYSAPDIMDRYDHIKELLTDKNNVIIGYSTDCDAKFLNYDLERFDLPFLNYTFWDVLKMYRSIANRTTNLKLDVLYGETGGAELMHHEALSDTKMTIEVLKKLLHDYNLTFTDIMENYKETSSESFNGRVIINDGSIFNYTKGGKTTVANHKILDDCIKMPPINVYSQVFKDKIFSIAPNIVKENFATTMAICNYTKKMGATFTLSVCDAHYLLVDEKSKIPKNRLRKGVKLLNLAQFEQLLNLEKDALLPENIVIDEFIGELPYNREWFSEYKKTHNLK